MIPGEIGLTFLVLAVIAIRAFFALAVLIALIGLFSRNRRTAALILAVVGAGFLAIYFLPGVIAPDLRGFRAVPAVTLTALPFYLVFLALWRRLRDHPSFHWALKIPAVTGAAGFVFVALYFLVVWLTRGQATP